MGHKATQQQRVHALWCMKHECFPDSCVIHDDDQPTADDNKKRIIYLYEQHVQSKGNTQHRISKL